MNPPSPAPFADPAAVSPGPRPVIHLEEIHRIYDTAAAPVHALRGVNLRILPGEFVAVMGASGSGKSTLMNLLGCLDRPTRGRYRLDDADVAELSPDAVAAVRNRTIGFVFQGFNLLHRATALENVELPMLYATPTLRGDEARSRARVALGRVGLEARADHTPSELSGGQQQRVAIARALVLDPKLLLADEPTGNLDTRTSIEIMGLFQQLNAQGATIVMVTHELDVARFAQRIVVMRDGRIVADRALDRPADPVAELARLPDEAEAETA